MIANGMASFHSILMLVVELFGHKYDSKGLRFALIPILDIVSIKLLTNIDIIDHVGNKLWGNHMNSSSVPASD